MRQYHLSGDKTILQAKESHPLAEVFELPILGFIDFLFFPVHKRCRSRNHLHQTVCQYVSNFIRHNER
jgi:hypothetical protein